MKKISIIIPAYNEEKRIGRTLKLYSEYFNNLRNKKKLNYDLFIVINNTKDKTEEIVKKWQKKNKSISYVNLPKGGKGYAVKEGFKHALKEENDFIGFADADLSTAPNEFFKLYDNIGDKEAIIASRWLSDSRVNSPQPILRRVASRVFNFFVRTIFLLKFRDTQCGAKLFKRKSLAKIVNNLTMTQWAFDVNLLYLFKINKLAVREFPTEWEDKELSHIDVIRASLKMFSGILRLRIMHSPFKRFIYIYDKLPQRLKVNHLIEN